MNASVPEDKPQSARLDTATQEKIREYCYELALALRRITGKVVEDDQALLEVSKETYPAQPNQINENQDQNASD